MNDAPKPLDRRSSSTYPTPNHQGHFPSALKRTDCLGLNRVAGDRCGTRTLHRTPLAKLWVLRGRVGQGLRLLCRELEAFADRFGGSEVDDEGTIFISAPQNGHNNGSTS